MSLKRLSMLLVGSPLRGFFTPYLGPIGPGASTLRMDELRGAARVALRPDFIEYSFPPSEHVPDKASCSTTAVVDLHADEPILWSRLDKKVRSQVRQAMGKGVRIFSPESIGAWLDEYYRIGNQNYLRQGLPNPAPREFFSKICTRLLPSGWLKVILAEFDGRLVSGGMYLQWRNTVYGLDGVTDRTAATCRAGSLVEWETIRWAKGAGYGNYDMIGAEVEGIARFKKSIGANFLGYESRSYPISLRAKFGLRVYYSIPGKLRVCLRPKGSVAQDHGQ
jgi:hypothetical protein